MRRQGFVLLLAFVVLALEAGASITVAPLSIKVPIAAGEMGTVVFLVRNVGKTTAEVHITLHDWRRTPEGKLQVLPPGTLEGSCAPWITYSPTALKLAPGEKAEVTVNIRVPEGVFGDRWALFLVAEYPPESEGETAPAEATGRTRVMVAYAVKLLRQDPEHASPAGEIRSVELLNTNPLRLRIVYTNTGNTHTVNRGTVEVRDIFGETVRSFPIGEFPTLPGEERIIVVEDPTEEPLPEGIYYAFATIDFGGEYLVQGGIMVQVPPSK
jgi:hypothetical protein